jgi:RecA/RadA recombinase
MSKSKLESTIEQIDKRFGKGAVIDGNTLIEVERQKTGSLGLDIITGGGWGKGKIVEIYAPESSGKSSVCIHTMVQAQKDQPNKRVALIDTEHAFDKNYAKNLGLNTDNLLISQPDCIWEEEFILTGNGYVKIKNILVFENIGSIGSDFTLENKLCSNLMYSNKVGFILRTGNFDLVTSKEHRVKTYNGYKTVGDLVPKKDYIEAIYRHKMFPSENETSLTPETSFLLGAFLGDWCYKRSSPTFTGIDEDLNSKILNIVDKNFSDTTYKQNGIAYRFVKKNGVHNSHIRSSLKNFLVNYLGEVAGQDKYVPLEIFKSGRENIANFLAGLIMTDGTVRKDGQSVSYTNYIKKVVLDVSSLLSFLEIPHRIYTKKKNMDSGVKVCYEICINSKEGLSNLIANIPLTSYKLDRLALADLEQKKSFIRFPKDMWRLIFEEIRNKGYSITEFSNIFYGKNENRHYFNNRRDISNEFIIKLNSILKSDVLQSFIDSDIYYTNVKEVAETTEVLKMIDLTVDENHNFIANNLLVHNCGEQALEIAEMLVDSGEISVLVIDSVAALTPQAEIDGEMGESKMGLHARLMSQALRKMTAKISKANTVCIFTNQLRDKIGVMYGNPEVTTGGNALKFYSSIRVDMRRKQGDKNSEGDVVNNHVTVKTVKNKLASPFQKQSLILFLEKELMYIAKFFIMLYKKGL